MTGRIQIPRVPVIDLWEQEAEAMGVGLPMLLATDLIRLRGVLAASLPKLTEWEWGLVSHVMDDEAMALLADREIGERIVSAESLHAAIVEWADGAEGDDLLQAEALAQRALKWTDVQRWALMIRARPR